VPQLHNETTGELLAPRVARATAPWARAIGYLGRSSVDACEGLWFDRCASVHTLGMRAIVDLVFVDANGAAVRVIGRARRNRVFCGGAGAAAAIELGPGVAETRVRIGDRLRLE
jgi:uncharacterized membrane protein (UPF0127 family)